MGCFDSVLVPCPKCGVEREFQSKSGDCVLKTYKLHETPPDVMEDVNRHAPLQCDCGIFFQVEFPEGKAIPVEVDPPARDWKLEYEQALESRASAVKREEEERIRAANWEAAYWALVKAMGKS